MASFGHCDNCGGNYGMCTDHSACQTCRCPPMGWKCPVCGAGLAPTTARCPCVSEQMVVTPAVRTQRLPEWLI
jgi:hypothetical protein